MDWRIRLVVALVVAYVIGLQLDTGRVFASEPNDRVQGQPFWVEVVNGPLNIRTCPSVDCPLVLNQNRPRQLSQIRKGGRIKVLEVMNNNSISGCISGACDWGRAAYGYIHLSYTQPLADPVLARMPTCPYSAAQCVLIDRTQQSAFFVRCLDSACTVVRSTWVSTGRMIAPDARDITPTPLGLHRTTRQLLARTMAGVESDGDPYRLVDIRHITYFDLVERLDQNGGYDRGFAFHEAYWHHSFGTPDGVSHGCVNLSADDAAYVYAFAVPGTLVEIF